MPLWESDLVEFWRAGRPFEVRDVIKPEDHALIESFAAENDLEITRQGATVVLSKKDW